MQTINSTVSSLRKQIEFGHSEESKALARTISPEEVGEVLNQESGNAKASVRMLVLELASQYHSENASRAILSRLSDEKLTIRSIANSLISTIAQKSLVPELFKAMGENSDLLVKGALARQIGLISNQSSVPQLRSLLRTTQDPAYRRDVEVAMARLGDDHESQQLVQRLTAPDINERIAAIRDVLYVGDPKNARYFRPLLEDRRDAIAVSLPHDPVVAARVCDLAVQGLAALGLKVSYTTIPTRRFTEPELREMLLLVTALGEESHG